MVQKGDTHYHCFGCGAHGDAISFLMSHVRMSFTEALEHLAERFGVALEQEERVREYQGPSKTELKEALDKACHFYHFALLYSEEGKEALEYLYERGIDLTFIRLFEVGYAPRHKEAFQQVMKHFSFPDNVLEQAGLLLLTENRRKRDFFSDRIMFPIRDALGSVIGFSGRKFKEETYGGKYINTPETPLFKKSNVLFGLSYSRKRIAKDRKAIIVEGQIDALKLIQAGFNFTVAGQGTAFGEGHVKELLYLGVKQVFLALDGDDAGQQATVKIGDLFQKKGVEVKIVTLPEGMDPDALLREEGPEAFTKLLEESREFLPFLVSHFSKTVAIDSPAGKNELAKTLSAQIQAWEEPVLVHESLRTLARLLAVPEETIGVEEMQPRVVKRFERLPFSTINPDLILEADLLRWLFLAGQTDPWPWQIVQANLTPDHFRLPVSKRLFLLYKEAKEQQKTCDLLTLSTCLEKEEESSVLSEIMQRKVNFQRAKEGVVESVHKILQRGWMEEREKIKAEIHSAHLQEEEALALAKKFDEIKKKVPQVVLPHETDKNNI